MKNRIAFLLALALLLGLLAGCGANNAPEAEPELAKGWYEILDEDEETAGYLHSTGKKLTVYDASGNELMEQTKFAWDEEEEAFTIGGKAAFTLEIAKKTTVMSVPKKSPLGLDKGDYTLEECDEEDVPQPKADPKPTTDPDPIVQGTPTPDTDPGYTAVPTEGFDAETNSVLVAEYKGIQLYCEIPDTVDASGWVNEYYNYNSGFSGTFQMLQSTHGTVVINAQLNDASPDADEDSLIQLLDSWYTAPADLFDQGVAKSFIYYGNETISRYYRWYNYSNGGNYVCEMVCAFSTGTVQGTIVISCYCGEELYVRADADVVGPLSTFFYLK